VRQGSALLRKWHIAITLVGVISVLLAGAWFYYVYAPPPVMPQLSAAARRAIIRVGESERAYLAYIPAGLMPHSPLVLVLHGGLMDGEMMRRGTGYEFDVLADRHGFAVVYPDGYKGNWNDCRRTDAYPAKRLNIDDIGFMRAIIARLHAENGIDPARVFAMGYSDGGEMAHRLAIEAPAEIAAIAAVEANLPAATDIICTPARQPSRAVILSATADPIMPYTGGEISLFGLTPGRGLMRSARQTVEYYVAAHGLDGGGTTERLPHKHGWDPTSVERTVWMRDGSQVVVFYKINGGGHVVPQPVYRWPRFLGRTTEDLNAPVIIWEFFVQAAGAQVMQHS
jgi:polyhydroxybutyrate depolymerase